MSQTAIAAPALRSARSGRTRPIRHATAPDDRHGYANRARVAGERRITIMEPDEECAAMLASLLRANGFVPEVHASFEATWTALHDAPAPYAIIAASDRRAYETKRIDGVTLLDCFRTARDSARTRLMLVTDDPYLETIYREDREVFTLGKPLIPTVILAFLGIDGVRRTRPRAWQARQMR